MPSKHSNWRNSFLPLHFCIINMKRCEFILVRCQSGRILNDLWSLLSSLYSERWLQEGKKFVRGVRNDSFDSAEGSCVISSKLWIWPWSKVFLPEIGLLWGGLAHLPKPGGSSCFPETRNGPDVWLIWRMLSKWRSNRCETHIPESAALLEKTPSQTTITQNLGLSRLLWEFLDGSFIQFPEPWLHGDGHTCILTLI